MKTVFAWLCGVVFGAGLSVAGMTNPAKVLAFLDVFGAWDPTLAFVMSGALAVFALGHRLAQGRERAWLGDAIALPTLYDVDRQLIAGASLFGVGWGLVGLCPGPALANLSRGEGEIWLFVASMTTGMVAYRWATRSAHPAERQPAH